MSSQISCTVKIEFSAAKRLMNYDGKCNNIHGYTHIIEATFINQASQTSSMVMDFYEIKNILGNWIDKKLDHNLILNKSDKILGDVIENLTGQTIFYLDYDPTAENIASYIKNEICPAIFPKNIICTRIKLYDNPSNYVEVT